MIDGADVSADGLAFTALAARGALQAALRLGDGLLGRKARFHLGEVAAPIGRFAPGHLCAQDFRLVPGDIEILPDTVRFRVPAG